MLKQGIGWIIGSFIASYGLSLWRGESIDWGHFISISIGGIVGLLIVKGVKAMKEDKD